LDTRAIVGTEADLNPTSPMTTHELEFSSAAESASEKAEREYPDINSMIWTLLAGVFAPPLLTLVNYLLIHALAPWACASTRPAALHLISLCILGLVALSGVGAVRCLKVLWRAHAVRSRAGCMAMAGVFGSAAFSTAIITEWLPSQYLLACQ
jgi:hypothetical protein